MQKHFRFFTLHFSHSPPLQVLVAFHLCPWFCSTPKSLERFSSLAPSPLTLAAPEWGFGVALSCFSKPSWSVTAFLSILITFPPNPVSSWIASCLDVTPVLRSSSCFVLLSPPVWSLQQGRRRKRVLVRSPISGGFACVRCHLERRSECGESPNTCKGFIYASFSGRRERAEVGILGDISGWTGASKERLGD